MDFHRKHISILLIVLVLAVIMAGIIIIVRFLSSDVYEDKKEFIDFANARYETNQLFKVSQDIKISYEYEGPVSFATSYNSINNHAVKDFREKKINELKKNFSTESARDSKTDRALIIDTYACRSANGTVSLAVYGTENEEHDRRMIKTDEFIHTYIFNEKSGNSIIPEQTLKKNYRKLCSEYLVKYIESTYSEDVLNEDWRIYLKDCESSLNKFIIKRDSITFYFDKDTILTEEQGIVSINIPASVIRSQIRNTVLKRYIFADKPMVALTYDDGPGGEAEDRILSCLKRNNSVATFFYYGSRAANNPTQIKHAYDMGCEIGNHTWSHPILTNLKANQIRSEVSRTNEIIKGATGEYPSLFRPSYGDCNDAVASIIGLPIIQWSVDTKDWQSRDAGKVFAAVKGSGNLDGKIILMHSIYSSTAEATEMIIPWLKEKGYQTVTVSELINYKYKETPKTGKVYR